jgi:hypothetical protein
MHLTSFIFSVLATVGNGLPHREAPSRFNSEFTVQHIVCEERRPVAFSDHLPDKALTVAFDGAGFPVAVYRKVVTEVCSKGECLPVNMRLFWAITGDYLGFAMEPGEVLTKYDHAVFTEADYSRLHALLNDRLSLLSTITEADIAPDDVGPGKLSAEKTDLISGATKKEIVPYTVGGAAYTTHSLWKLVYGVSRDSVVRVIEKDITASIITTYLRREGLSDKVWALSMVNKRSDATSDLLEELAAQYRVANAYLRDRILDVLLEAPTSSGVTESFLTERYKESEFSQKRKIIHAVGAEGELGNRLFAAVLHEVPADGVPLITTALRAAKKRKAKDDRIVGAVKALLKHPDESVVRAARDCLRELK